MSDGRSPLTELRDRLIWLRTLGVEEIGGAGPVHAGPVAESAAGDDEAGDRRAGAGYGAEPVTQPGLFGSGRMDGAAPPDRGDRPRLRRGAGGAPASPIATTVPPDAPDTAARLSLIRADLGDCRRCKLHEKRTSIVFGVGDPQARLMFIGEGPGADEDRQGEPFVGRAGQLLTKIIEAMGLRRDQVYIANVVKCRPPENRTPLPDEVITCSPFLFQQIAAIRPRVIVCLGTPAAQTVLGTRETITRMRGTFREVDGIRIMPTFHPAYLLRNPAAKREVWDDMKLVMACLKTEE
jgi:DNA polymerase